LISPADIAILGAVALMLFGPEQLPRVARRVGNVVREMQNTSHSFIREMERAADLSEERSRAAAAPAPAAEPAFPLPGEYQPLPEHHAGLPNAVGLGVPFPDGPELRADPVPELHAGPLPEPRVSATEAPEGPQSALEPGPATLPAAPLREASLFDEPKP
jgi:Sec-independent protein translocase protein TatA